MRPFLRPPLWPPPSPNWPTTFIQLAAMSAFFFSLSTTAQQSIAPNSREEISGCEPGQIPSAVRVDAEGRPELFCQLPACALFPEDSAAAESSLPPPMPTTTAVNTPSSATSSSSSSTSMMMHSSPMVEQQTWGSTRQQSSEMASTRSTQHHHRQHRPQHDEEREGENGEEGEEAVDEQAIRRRIRRSTMQPSRTTLTMGTGVTRAAAAEDDDQQLQQQTMTTKMPAVVRCGDTFTDVVCDLPNEWTGALSEVNNGTHISLFMQCCTVANLAQWAAPLKRVVIGTDEQYGGGPVLHNGEMVAFDLIKEIRKNVTTDNQVLYVLSIHRALCLAPVPAIPPPPSAASASRNRLSKFSRLYPGARVGSNGGGGGQSASAASAQSQQQQSAMDAARQHLPYSLIRKAVQKQREQRLMAINSRRRHPPRKSQEVGRENSLGGAATTDMAVLKPVATATLDGGVDVPGGSGEEQGFGSLKAASAADGRQSRPRVSPPPSSSLMGRSAGGGGGGGGDGQPQQRQRAIYGRRRPFRPFMYTQVPPLTQGGVVDDYDEEGEAAGGNGIPLWLLHRRRTPWSRLRRIGTDGSRQRTERPAGVEEGARLSQAAGNSGGSGNGAGGRFLTTSIQRRNGQQQHQQQQPQHNRLRGQRPQGKGVVIETSRTELLGPGRQQPATLEKQKRKPEMAVHGHGGGATAGGTTKPRLYSDGAGQYAPDSQLPIRANSDDEFQSVVEQEILPDTLGPETAAAAAEEQQPSTAGLEPESSFEPVSETATPTAGENNFVTLIPQQNSYQQAQQQPQPLPVAVSAPVAAYQPQSLFPTGNSFGFGPFLPPTGQQLQQQHLPVVSAAAGGCRGGAGCAGGANANNYNGNANANNNNYYNGFATSYPNGNGNGFTTSYGVGAGGCQNGRGGCGGSQSHVAPQPKCSSCACPACQHCRRSPRSTGSCSAEGGCGGGGGGGGGGDCSAGCSCPEECACQAEAQANAAEWQAYQSQYGNGQAAQGQAPASSGTATGLNGAFAAMQCFSGDQQLRTARGRVRMDELRVGDLVLSVDESLVSYSPVVMFLHRRPQERAHFRLVQTEGGHQLKLTDFHLVWAGCTRLRLLRAMDLRPGQCLFVLADQEEEAAEGNNRTMLLPDSSSIPSRGIGLRTRLISRRITKIEQIQEEGIYAPLTANGNLIVNGVLASCHSNMAAQTLQQTFFRWLRSLHWLLSKWPFPWPTPSMEETPAGSEGDGAGGTAMVDGELPLGVRLVTQVLDTLLPKALLGGG